MSFLPYRVLGLKPTATQAEIKSAYRKLARQNHPDRNPNNARAEDRFKDIANAYALLSNANKRRQFDAGEIDAQGNAYAHSKTSSGQDAGYDNYRRGTGGSAKNTKNNRFNTFFRDRSSIKANGADVSYTLKVDFIDAAIGAIKNVRMTTGKTLKVQIPQGTESGQVLRLKNQGMAGIGGGKSGDALVEISIRSGDIFHGKGLDVFSEEAITLSEALLGGRIEARTIHGPVIVTVPEGANSGTKLRLKGRGIHPLNGTKRGDHYVTLTVVLPQKNDSELKKFVKRWAVKKPYSVRNETLNQTAAE